MKQSRVLDAIGRLKVALDARLARVDSAQAEWKSDVGQEIGALRGSIAKQFAMLPLPEKGEKGDPGIASTEPGPKGDKGDPGEVDPNALAAAVSAEVVRAIGALDTEALRGPPGRDGENIKGDKGEKGDPGEGKRGKTGDKGDRGDPGRDGVATRDELHELIKVGVAESVAAIVPEVTETIRKTLPKVEWHGPWQGGTEYTRGDLTTWGGSVWHCDVDLSTETPDSPLKHWRLAVKRGRDGRDGRDAR